MYPVLLNDNRQIHAGMNGTIDVKCPRRVEWPDLVRIVAIERDIHRGRARFLLGYRAAIDPRTILNNMYDSHVINQRER